MREMLKMDNKNELRRYYKSLRTAMDPYERRRADERICENVLSLEEVRNCRTVFIYVSGPIEVDTRMLISVLLGQNEKKVCCPKCVKGTNIMEFYRIKSFDDLEEGAFGISEPKQQCEKMTEDEESVCLIPGLSFDTKGFRLGFGKGFYDRFLSDYKGSRIGLCYEACMCESLPVDSFDICAQAVVTDKGVVNIRKG